MWCAAKQSRHQNCLSKQIRWFILTVHRTISLQRFSQHIDPITYNNSGKQGRTKEELLSAHITSGVRMQIPLFVGRMRTIDKLRERAVDVIVNTGVAEAAVKVSSHACCL